MQALSRFAAITGIAAVLASPTPLLAQGCPFGDDGFASVPCCTPVTPNYISGWGFLVSADYACLDDCRLGQTWQGRVQVAHVPVLCDLDVVAMIFTTGGPLTDPGYSGTLLAKYSRTWKEPIDPTGVLPPRQVWRWLVNGDLQVTGGALTCPTPPQPVLSPVHFHGHIDVACEEDATGAVLQQFAMSLHHLQECIEHNTFSCQPTPMATYPGRSYHLVAPGGFNFAIAASTTRSPVGEAVRSTLVYPNYTCIAEGPIDQIGSDPLTPDCMCVAVPPAPPPVTHLWTPYFLFGSVACPAGGSTPFGSVPVGLPLPPLPAGLTQLSLGAWTGAAGTFPGTRELAVHWGVIHYPDPCNTTHPPYSFVTGVSTFGMEVESFTHPDLARGTLDLQDMISWDVFNTGVIKPYWGCLYMSKLVWNINLL